MAARKLPPGTHMIHVGVSMKPDMWERVQAIARFRRPPVSASQVLREFVDECIDRRFGPRVVAPPEPTATPPVPAATA